MGVLICKCICDFNKRSAQPGRVLTSRDELPVHGQRTLVPCVSFHCGLSIIVATSKVCRVLIGILSVIV